jgi:hypothetical protein
MMSEITESNETNARGETVSPLLRFRVREGCRFGAANEYGSGDIVSLPAAVLTAFGDKLEAMSEGDEPENDPAGGAEDNPSAEPPPAKTKTARGK